MDRSFYVLIILMNTGFVRKYHYKTKIVKEQLFSTYKSQITLGVQYFI